MKQILVALLLALPFTSLAEEKNKAANTEATATVVEGTIADMNDYAPLSDVKVVISSDKLNISKTLQTDKNGRFVVSDLPAGSYQVRFERDGYEPLTRNSLIVQNDRKNSFGFFMFED